MKALKTLSLVSALAIAGISTSAIATDKPHHNPISCNKTCRVQALRKELNDMPKNDSFYTQMVGLIALSPKTFDVASRVMIIEKLDEISRKLDHAVPD